MRPRLSITLHAVGVRRAGGWVLHDISLHLRAGERWALIGGNGAGKTQLLKLLGTDVWPTPSGKERRIYRLGRRHVDVIEAKRRIAYVGAELQDKYARYGWNLEVRELLATGMHRTDLLQRRVSREESQRVEAMLELCGLEPLAGRRFLSLSYGQKRLVLLARALVQEPDWLLLDEFYNGLDAHYRGRLDALLDHARRRGQAWIAAAHRAVDVPRGTQRLLQLRAGAVHSSGPLRAADLDRLADQARETPRGNARAIPRGNAGATPHGDARPTARGNARAAPRGNARPTPRGDAPSVGPVGAPPREALLRLTGVDLYVDYRAVLRDVNWTLRGGEHWAVFGANGAGKSSLLKLLYGDLSPALGGRMERSGFPRGTPIETWKRQVGLVSPELQTDHAENISLLDLVASGRHASIGMSDPLTAADRRDASRWLEFFGLTACAKRLPRELSYGQLRRALIARALAGDKRMLLLDEPLTGLDPRQRATMKRLLEHLMRRRLTLVIAVHHPEDLPRGMTHALDLHNRRAQAREFHSAT